MENATKALLIAAGVMIAVMILSLLLIGYNQISDYYNKQHESTEVDQLTKFNSKFENYHRNKIRGSDMISLMNRVIDYNTNESYQAGTNYERIGVTIDLKSNSVINQFKYDKNDASDATILNNTIINSSYEITNKSGKNIDNDNKLTAITGAENKLMQSLNSLGVSNTSSSQLQSLASNISNIMIEDNDQPTELWQVRNTKIKNRQKRAELIKRVLNIDITYSDEETAVANSSSQDKINEIKKIALQYYQYIQFKRAYFDCTEVKYDEKTGRVCEMNFEVRTNGGNVEFN